MGLVYIILLWLMFIFGSFIEYTDDEYTHWREIKAECEKSLPRDQNCILYAKPEALPTK